MSLTEVLVNFKRIEQIAQKKAFEYGREMLKTILENWDAALRESRDKQRYINKGSRQTTIKTVLGEVEYSRVLYEIQEAGKTTGRVYLLDEAMGDKGSGQFSEMMVELIVGASCDGAYRNAARTVSEMTGQKISHTAVWNVVQTVGAAVESSEKQAASRAASGKGEGTIEAAVLMEEQDGIWLSLQGKDRKKHGKSKEMKVAIAYDGAKKTGKKRYELTNKVACANFESVDNFVKRKEGFIAGVYNVDEIEMRLLNGDGASWIRRSQTDDTVHFQLDPFHCNKAIKQYVSNLESRKMITKLLYSKDIDLLLHVIEVETHSTDDESERENYLKLLSYFRNNKDGLVPIHRRGLNIPALSEGKEYRHMGAMESNVYTLIGSRMKGGRGSWSISGGNNLARFLCLKHTSRLSGALGNLGNSFLPERYIDEVIISSSAAKTPTHEGKGYNGFHHASIPSSQKWLKDLASMKPFSSI